MKSFATLLALASLTGMASAAPAGSRTEHAPRSYTSGGYTCAYTCPQTIGLYTYSGQPTGPGSCQYQRANVLYSTCYFSTTTGRESGNGGGNGLTCPSNAGPATCTIGTDLQPNQFKRDRVSRQSPEIQKRQYKPVRGQA